ncbi:MAG: hypothetical protein US49_C0002G0100 [candidate division TM6 bacterium GW2011_GWF2_37_49]|nr:MAG: hypothetical protein US49_C0002G0100 [candidate division TM6 bacterium GW2011_GWF2_37_49]
MSYISLLVSFVILIYSFSPVLCMYDIGRVRSPVGIVLNGPSGSGKSTISKLFAKHFNSSALIELSIDSITDHNAGIIDEDSDEVVEFKLNKRLAEEMQAALADGKNVICDTIAISRAEVGVYRNIHSCKIIMCFIHNTLPRLINNLEARNRIAETLGEDHAYLEKRSFSQVLKNFGSFYIPSEIDYGLDTISRQQLDFVFRSKEARIFAEDVSDKNGQRPGSPRPLGELMERYLIDYPIFECLRAHEFMHLQLVNYDVYDLIIHNESPKISEAIIFKFFCDI